MDMAVLVAVAVTIASTHCACPQKTARLSWPGWLVTAGRFTGLSRTVSDINGDFSRKSQILPTSVALTGLPLELGIAAKTRMMGQPCRESKFDDIFSHLETIHERDKQIESWADRQTDTGRQQRPRLYA